MKVLVVTASKHGSTREIASAIARGLRNSHLEADLKDASKHPSTEGYDAVVFGSAIYAGNWLPEAREFAEQHRETLSRLPVWLFSSGPLGEENPKPEQNLEHLAAPLGAVEVRDHKIFSGRLDTAELSLGERLITKMVGAPSGDFRDWEEIQKWAKEIAMALHPVMPTVVG
jgi:menaquinone-dependent protoporphyrinogen oxidase